MKMQLSLVRSLVLSIVLLTVLGCGESLVQPERAATPPAITNAGISSPLTVVLGQFMADDWYEAESMQSRAKTLLGSNDVWIEETDMGLSVRYGRFVDYESAEQGFYWARSKYRQLSAGNYQFCYIYDIPKPDPPAPLEWNLYESQCAYSLDIATYYNVPEQDYYDRKADAVKAVETLRADGEQAYFVHGQHESRVYVGCFPPTVVQRAYVNGQPQQVVNPLVQAAIARYEYRYENGAVVHRLEHDLAGNTVRRARTPVLVNIDQLWQEQSF